MSLSVVKLVLAVALILQGLVLFAVWGLPVELAQSWAAQRAGADPFAKFEAIGQAEVLWGAARLLLPVTVGLTLWGILKCDALTHRLKTVCTEFLAATHSSDGCLRNRACTSIALRAFIMIWAVLASVHLTDGLLQRAREWVYYKFNSGDVVLPNISDGNRDVIRYLKETTPPGSRILVCSDQKLFFLSYYLLPRRLFHFIHPESEFVIPLANQTRQLSAYRLEDLTEEQRLRWKPDYVLEYYEGAEFIDPSRRGEDPNWVRFWQARNRSAELPPFVVVLRPATGGNK